jgi:hypothetical protein
VADEQAFTVFTIEQLLKLNPGILTAIMAKNTPARNEPALDDFKAHRQLARIVSEVVQELENGTTQTMLEACMQESRYR